MYKYFLYILIIVAFLINASQCSHFRGGYISWKPTGNAEREIELYYRLAYKADYFSESNDEGQDCTEAAIRDQTPVPTGGEFHITLEDTGGEEISRPLFDGPPHYTCTDIRADGDDERLYWASGFNRSVWTLPEQDELTWEIGYDSCCWVKTLVNYGSPRTWRLRTTINLSPRQDLNNRPNSSPYVEGLPMKIVAQHCLTYIPINAIDKDGDKIKCRWTSENKGECESPNCGNPDSEIFEMKRDTCKIKVDASQAEPGLYAVAVIIEDFPQGRRGRRNAFSKVPFQFLVLIQQRDVSCNRVITEAPYHTCYAVPFVFYPAFQLTLRAQTTDPSIPIQSIDMITQPGMTKSELISDGNGRYHVDITWTPPADKFGSVEQLCYQAVDQENIAGQEVCVKLYIGGETPEPIPESSFPSSNSSIVVPFYNQQWELHFSDSVMVNELNGFDVMFFFENGTEVYGVNLETATNISVSAVFPYTVSFTTPDISLAQNTTYIIRLNEGAVLGVLGCFLPSIEAEWSFTTSYAARGAPSDLIIDYKVSTECFPNFMVTYIERVFLSNIDPSLFTLEDPDCYGVEHNDSHVAIGSTYGKCGTRAIPNADRSRVAMVNTIYFPLAGTYVYGNSTTRSENLEVLVNCSIPSRRVVYVEFQRNVSTIVIKNDNVGDFNFSLKMFPDETYQGAFKIWDFPIYVEEHDELFFEARTFGNPDQSPFLEECIASPSADPEGNFGYVIIRNGCPLDRTIKFHDSAKARKRFSIQAFSFVGHNLRNSIYVHCDIRTCSNRDGSCDTDCPELAIMGKRSARTSSSFSSVRGNDDTDGPIKILSHRRCSDSDTFSNGEMVLLGLVCLSILMSAILLFMVFKVAANQRNKMAEGALSFKDRQCVPPIIIPTFKQ